MIFDSRSNILASIRVSVAGIFASLFSEYLRRRSGGSTPVLLPTVPETGGHFLKLVSKQFRKTISVSSHSHLTGKSSKRIMCSVSAANISSLPFVSPSMWPWRVWTVSSNQSNDYCLLKRHMYYLLKKWMAAELQMTNLERLFPDLCTWSSSPIQLSLHPNHEYIKLLLI